METTSAMPEPQLLIACGALAKELVFLQRAHAWEHLTIRCLPADLHNTPDKIAPAVRLQLQAYKPHYRHILIAYADCGTGGLLDQVIQEENSEECAIERLPGAHCYEFYAGSAAFDSLHNEELGTFYLTDFLVRHFERLIIQGLGLDKHPAMRDMVFGHYKRLVYLAQDPDDTLRELAQAAAARLGLTYVYRPTGYGDMAMQLKSFTHRVAPLTFYPTRPSPIS